MDIASIELSVEALIGSLVALSMLFIFCRSILMEDVICISGKTRHSWKSIKIIEQVCVKKTSYVPSTIFYLSLFVGLLL